MIIILHLIYEFPIISNKECVGTSQWMNTVLAISSCQSSNRITSNVFKYHTQTSSICMWTFVRHKSIDLFTVPTPTVNWVTEYNNLSTDVRKNETLFFSNTTNFHLYVNLHTSLKQQDTVHISYCHSQLGHQKQYPPLFKHHNKFPSVYKPSHVIKHQWSPYISYKKQHPSTFQT